jgi:hypothetical protein
VTRIASVAELDYVDGPVNLYRRHSNNTVLEVDAARQARLLRDELPWRRWLLQTLTPDQIDPDSFLQAYLTFELVAARAAAAAGTTASMLVAANSADREKAHACLELGLTEYAAGRQPQAVHAFIQSLGFDPWNLASRHILQSLASSVGQIFGLDRPPVSEVEDATTRPFTVLAFADEVLADPDLLADYARHFTSADPATLLLYAPDAHPPTISQAFSDLLAGLGLNDESGPDIVAHVVPRSADGDRYLAHCVDAVLSRQTQQCRFERVASFQSPRLHELRSAAELYWKTQANSPAR